MKKTYFIVAGVVAMAFMACVSTDDLIDNSTPTSPEVPIVNTPDDAQTGELLIKFRPEVSALLDQAQAATRAAGVNNGKMTRSGVTTVDELMTLIGDYELERVFPVDARHEERTRKNGLHLWYIVHFDQNADIEEVAQKLSQLGELSKIQYSKSIRRSYKEPADRAAKYAAGNPIPMDMDEATGLGLQWHYNNEGEFKDGTQMPHMLKGADVNCAEAWKKCKGDPSIIVAVMDEGVMWSHPDLADNMWVNEGETYGSDEDKDDNGYVGDVHGYNFVFDSGRITWDDLADTGHGTHVAGTIAAVNGNGKGVCGIAGGSGSGDGVKIMSLQIFSGDYGVTIPNEVRAVKYAADNGAVILQCSWGYLSALANPLFYPQRGPRDDEEFEKTQPVEKEAFDYFIYNAGSPNGVLDGGLVIFASGNEFAAMAAYPGAYKDYICVSAMGADFTPSTYSNYGPGVDITAPGGDTDYHMDIRGGVLSTMPPRVSDGKYYGYMDGTSMACPHMSGVAALGLSYAAKLHKHFDSRQFRDLILRSVKEIDTHLMGTKLYNYNWSSIGEVCPTQIDLGVVYKGKMGAGVADAALLLKNIETEGRAISLPNVYVAVNAEQKIDVMRCFRDGETATFTATVDDTSIATVAVEGSVITVKGITTGATPFTVTSSTGESQTAYITVRKTANDNGWL